MRESFRDGNLGQENMPGSSHYGRVVLRREVVVSPALPWFAYNQEVFVEELLEFAEAKRIESLSAINVQTQSILGQFFTPIAAAKLIASLPVIPVASSVRILDPGAGSGVLSAAIISRVLAQCPEMSVNLVAVERDCNVFPYLQATLDECVRVGAGRVRCQAVLGDFITDYTGLNKKYDLDDAFDLVIENPPYRKLAVNSSARRVVKKLGVDVPNLYAAFLFLSARALARSGQLIAITPRSFFNGTYFRDFRQALLRMVALKRVHVFNSRSSVFIDSGVLQENVIVAATRDASPSDVVLSSSDGDSDAIVSRTVEYGDVVFPNDVDSFIRLPTSASDSRISEIVLRQPCSLADIGVQVSTGKVVDFRSREALSDVAEPDYLPLIYPGNLQHGTIVWPREIKKPQWFSPFEDRFRKLVLPSGWYAVVKRFSSKEERRRVVASTWSPVDYPSGVAFENHLNVFHRQKQGLDESLAKGLAIWMNSTLIDRFFRIFSGHTQVNATDIRTLKFPQPRDLRKLGRFNPESQEQIDELVMALVGK